MYYILFIINDTMKSHCEFKKKIENFLKENKNFIKIFLIFIFVIVFLYILLELIFYLKIRYKNQQIKKEEDEENQSYL